MNDEVTPDQLNEKVPTDIASRFERMDHVGIQEDFRYAVLSDELVLPQNGEFSANVPDVVSGVAEQDLGLDKDSHLQGYAQYIIDEFGAKPRRFYIFAHGLDEENFGVILLYNDLNGPSYFWRTPDGWNHPGGLATIGRYLFIPCERRNQSIISIHDLVIPKYPEVQRLEFDGRYHREHRAGCVGITDFLYVRDGTPIRCYLLLVGANKTYYAYVGICRPNIADVDFEGFGKIELPYDCQGIGLVTDKENNIYLAALYPEPIDGPSFGDWGYLYKLTVQKGGVQAEKIAQKWFKSTVGGWNGIHFRYGDGIRVTARGKLVVFATARNVENNLIRTDYWTT